MMAKESSLVKLPDKTQKNCVKDNPEAKESPMDNQTPNKSQQRMSFSLNSLMWMEKLWPFSYKKKALAVR